MLEGVEERNERQCIGRVGKQSEVYEKLFFSTYLQMAVIYDSTPSPVVITIGYKKCAN